jgi:hypothetical protein
MMVMYHLIESVDPGFWSTSLGSTLLWSWFTATRLCDPFSGQAPRVRQEAAARTFLMPICPVKSESSRF